MPEKFKDRLFYQNNTTVTRMRTTPEERAPMGKDTAKKIAASKGPAAICLPLKGVSAMDADGQPFHSPQTRAALFGKTRQHHGSTELVELPNHINDPEFAEAAARRLPGLLQGVPPIRLFRLLLPKPGSLHHMGVPAAVLLGPRR